MSAPTRKQLANQFHVSPLVVMPDRHIAAWMERRLASAAAERGYSVVPGTFEYVEVPCSHPDAERTFNARVLCEPVAQEATT